MLRHMGATDSTVSDLAGTWKTHHISIIVLGSLNGFHVLNTSKFYLLGYLGCELRVVLPSCAVSRIRATFPSASYVGFKL